MFRFTKSLLILLILPIFLFSLTHCSSDENNPVNNNDEVLFGTWDLTGIDQTLQGETIQFTPEEMNLTIVIVFESNHSFSITQTIISTGTEFYDQGTWNLLGNNLVLNSNGDAPTTTLSYSADNNLLILMVDEIIEGQQVSFNYYFVKR